MKRLLTFGVVGLLWCGTVEASLELMSVGGAWSNVTGDPMIEPTIELQTVPMAYGNGSEEQVRWGVPYYTTLLGKKSGLGFTGIAPTPTTIELGQLFEVGQLRHFNNAINFRSSATGTDLRIDVTISSPTDMATGNFGFHMDLDETENTTGDPILDADFISFTKLNSQQYLMIDGKVYTLNLLGFGSEENLNLGFVTPEYQNNEAILFGQLITASPHTTIPVPGSLLLCSLGTGILSCIGKTVKRRGA